MTTRCTSCLARVVVDVTLPYPGRYHGHPDNWEPGEPGCMEPEACPECGEAFEFEKLCKEARTL